MKESMREEECVWERWQEASPIYSTRSHSYTSYWLNSYSAHMKLWAYRARFNTPQLSVWQTWTMSKLDCNFNELSLSIHTVTDLWSLLRALLCRIWKKLWFVCLLVFVYSWCHWVERHHFAQLQWPTVDMMATDSFLFLLYIKQTSCQQEHNKKRKKVCFFCCWGFFEKQSFAWLKVSQSIVFVSTVDLLRPLIWHPSIPVTSLARRCWNSWSLSISWHLLAAYFAFIAFNLFHNPKVVKKKNQSFFKSSKS